MNRCRHRDKHYLTNFLTTQNKNHDLQPQQAGEHSVQPPVGQPGLHPPVKPPGLNPQMDPPDQDQADHHQPHQAVPLLSKQQEEPVQLPPQPAIPVHELHQPPDTGQEARRSRRKGTNVDYSIYFI